MRMILKLVTICTVATLAACSAEPAPPSGEDCEIAGDEDRNGLADCEDPACAAAAACQSVCGDGKPGPGESCDDGNRNSGDGCDANCTATACGNGIPTAGEACDDGNQNEVDGCERSCTISMRAYIKASNPDADDGFGWSVALSADGLTLAATAPFEDSAGIGVGSNQSGNSADNAGAVYVFTWSGTAWRQQAYIKASNTAAYDRFGHAIALSADGSTLVVSAPSENSAATGVGGDQTDDSLPEAGAVYVFSRSGSIWSQQAYLKASNPDLGDSFGVSIALSDDGSTLAVGAEGEQSAATGIDGAQADNSAPWAGAVYVFTRAGATWSQQAYIKASNTEVLDFFGASVALSDDGSTLAVGAKGEHSAATGIDGAQTDNSAPWAGAVYVFTRAGATWSQQAYVKASNTDASDVFGWSVALSNDGSILAVGAPSEGSAATGIDGAQADNSVYGAGAVYVLARSGVTWSQQAYVKASNTGANDSFGKKIALAGDGSTLAVAAIGEDGATTSGELADDFAHDAGAVYMLTRSGTMWSQRAYVKAYRVGTDDSFGSDVALAAGGSVLVVGARGEDSAATGIGGSQTDNSAMSSGAVYVIR